MVLSTAIDRAVSNIDFSPLAGKDVFLDDQYLKGVVDANYIIATLRQHLLASGCRLKSDRKEATYIVEARSGGVGTNRHDAMLGIPAVNVPTAMAPAGSLPQNMPSALPEIPFAKMTEQKGVAKLAVFAYNQHTGMAVWQSGAVPIVTNAKDSWMLGVGPLQRGSIYSGTNFAGSNLIFFRSAHEEPLNKAEFSATEEADYRERSPLVRIDEEAGKQHAPAARDAQPQKQ